MKAETSASIKLVALGLFIVFFIFLGLSVPFYLRQRGVINNWTRVDATVLSSNVVTVPAERRTNYDAQIMVEYHIGNTVVSRMVKPGPSSRRSRAESWVNHYPAGRKLQIAYHPQNPTEIRLDPGYNRRFFAAPLMITQVGAVFGCAAAVLYLIARRAERRRRRESGE